MDVLNIIYISSFLFAGTEKEKIMWSFQFYDVNKDGRITKEEFSKVLILLF